MAFERDGGTAFPCDTSETNDYGMTLRDYFAAKALTGLLSCQSEETGFYQPANAAEEAYKMADAMLEARNKPD